MFKELITIIILMFALTGCSTVLKAIENNPNTADLIAGQIVARDVANHADKKDGVAKWTEIANDMETAINAAEGENLGDVAESILMKSDKLSVADKMLFQDVLVALKADKEKNNSPSAARDLTPLRKIVNKIRSTLRWF